MKAQQLKNAILQLAIQGKLVPQDPTDEPASVLLEKIKQKKDRLIAEGKIKKSKKTSDKTPSTTEQDFPFEIPESWVWVRLEDVCQEISDIDHKMPQEYKGKNGIPYISPKDFYDKNGIDFANAKKVSEEDYFLLSKKFAPQKNDIIFPRYGTIGVVRVIEENIKLLVSYSCACIRVEYINMQYVVAYLNSELAKLEIKKYTNKTTQPNVGLKSIKKFIIPLPPLNEQKRIVAKIEELLPYIEQYAEKEEKLTALHQQFPEQLKKSILQAAIQGKLTEQNPNDEPASALIERIKAEKLRPIAEKKLKKPKVISEIIMRDNLPYEIVNGKERCIADEVPFEIPESWVWVRLSEISKITMGQSPDNKYLGKEGIEFHQGKSFFSEYIIESSDIYCSLPNKLATPNSILLCVRAPVGIVNITNRELCIGRGLASIDPIYVNTIFLYYALFCYKNYYERKSTGSTFKAISKDIIDNTIIPIPPLNEQIRIVEKIETLFSTLQNLSQK
ncbi:Type I restriction-modification system S subunit [Actinobacillus pleuropneumoniae]|uniref:restriction endonuclease subunit S n=5 Tax=Actinobacillus pleuropneumoniae TaxID=715 RepID=UPI000E18F9E8|nr:restriction endonuclease subunit S [Actinobacillus pleuropneumoniae]UKH11911.1 restriction endonuclease subunit S [Actinobacillus pleuropneumoniae serovar 6 str. Femo]SUU66965.1 Type I restriction-modification system S subunit [Actinobacillus pleuropneumoniae]